MMENARLMKFDLGGRLANTKVAANNAFLPMFEAVVNGIHATQDRFGGDVASRGLVEIRVYRDLQQIDLPGSPGRPSLSHITRIVVTDNGIGFTDKNLESFETSDSTAKADRGGKGVGRFTWLVVFSEAQISTVFSLGSMGLRERKFLFHSKGIDGYSESDVERGQTGTTVELTGPREKYVENLRRSTTFIIEKLFEHCFSYLVLERCPRILLTDETEGGIVTTESISDYLTSLMMNECEQLYVGDHELTLRHVQHKHTAGRKHSGYLCADHRVVKSFSLVEVSDLESGPILNNDGASVVHHVYVTGPVLDQSVDATRTYLDLPDGEPLLEFAGELDQGTLRSAVGQKVNERLADTLRAGRETNRNRIEQYIRTQQPEYRTLIDRVPHELERMKWSDNQSHLDETLYKIQQSWEMGVRKRQAEVEQTLIATALDRESLSDVSEIDAIAEDLFRVVSEMSDASHINLVRYVTRRRAVLKLLEQFMSRFQGQTLEKRVHEIVFPLKKTGDQVSYDEHNLWLVDDTLSFYEHLASDLSFRKNATAPVDSLRRPDIIAFKAGDPYQHIAIVEFKRPDSKDDPVRQLMEYAELLRQGGGINAYGATLPGVSKNVRIDAYAIVTLSPEMEKVLKLAGGNLKKDEGEGRWYGRSSELNMTIEVFDYSTFVRRAKQRNLAFFNKLNLP